MWPIRSYAIEIELKRQTVYVQLLLNIYCVKNLKQIFEEHLHSNVTDLPSERMNSLNPPI